MKPMLYRSKISQSYPNTGVQYFYLLPLLLFIFFVPSVTLNHSAPLLKINVSNGFASARKLINKEKGIESVWLFVGKPFSLKTTLNLTYAIQVNDAFIDYNQIPFFFNQSCHTHKSSVLKVVFLKIDKNVKMDRIYKIRDKIRKTDLYIYHICYEVR
jgi:biopolymer transport protein ExbD